VNGKRRYKYLVLERDRSYSDSIQKFSETDIINILEFLIDNQHICYVWWTRISTDCPHTYGLKPMRQTSYRGSHDKHEEASPFL